MIAQTTPTDWIQLADRYGLPLVFLAVIGVLAIWGVRAVWSFCKPLANRLVESVLALVDKQSVFIDKVSEHQQELKELVEVGQNGHVKTHEALANLTLQVTEIHNKVRARQ